MIIEKNNKILFLKRHNISFHGFWCLPTGKIEENESPLQAIIRETKEEVGVEVNPSLATIVASNVPNIYNPNLMYKDVNLFFLCKEFKHNPINMEPNKHIEMEWFNVESLPNPILDVVRQGIFQYSKGINYGDLGY